MHDSTLPAGGVAWILRLGVAVGGDEAALLAQAGIHAETFTHPDARVPRASSLALWRAIVPLVHDPALPVRYGQSVIPESLGVLSYLLRQSPTLGDMLQTVEHFQALTQSRASIQVRRSAEVISIGQRLFPEEVALRYPPQFVISSFTAMIRAGLGDSWSPQGVFFQHPRVPWVAALRGVFRCPVRFDAPTSGITIHPADASLSLRDSDPHLRSYLHHLATTVLESMPERPPWTMMVMHRLAQAEPDALPDLERMGGELGMSGRTLQRRLQGEGRRYSELVEGVRIDHAKRELATGLRSVTEVADHLGYAGADSFSRAFRRWTGQAPLAWRKQVLELSPRAKTLSPPAKVSA